MEYEQKLRALGRLLDARVVRDISITEMPDGLMVMALGQMDESNQQSWSPINFEVTHGELTELMGVIKADPTHGGSTRRAGLW